MPVRGHESATQTVRSAVCFRTAVMLKCLNYLAF